MFQIFGLFGISSGNLMRCGCGGRSPNSRTFSVSESFGPDFVTITMRPTCGGHITLVNYRSCSLRVAVTVAVATVGDLGDLGGWGDHNFGPG